MGENERANCVSCVAGTIITGGLFGGGKSRDKDEESFWHSRKSEN